MIFNMRAKEVLGVIESDSTELVGSYDSALKINKIGGVCEQTADERNLFKFESLTAPTNGVLALHESGVAALLEDYMFIGTANSYGGCVVTVANPIKGNGLYSNLFVISGSYTGTIKHKAVDSNGNETTAVAIGTALSLDSTKEYTKFVIAFEEGAVCTDLVLGFKVSKTDYNTFTPYIENVPSPDYPVEIKKSVVSEIRTSGTQLIPAKITLNNTGLSVKIDEQNRIFLSGTTKDSTQADLYLYGMWGHNVDLGIRGVVTLTTNYGSASLVHQSTTFVRADVGVPKTVNVTDDNYITAILIRFPANTTYNGYLEVMLNAGAKCLPYEPYKESVITFSKPIELYNIGKVQDTIEGGKVNRKYYEEVVTSVKSMDSYGLLGKLSLSNTPYINADFTSDYVMCDSFISYGLNELRNKDYGITMYGGSIYIRNVDIEQSVDGYNTWLASHPITVVYELAEEVIEDLPLTDQIALNCLKTFHGVTYVVFDGEVQPTLNSEYATNLEGAITLQAHADNRIGKANTLVNRAEGESDVFEVKVEHGLVYLYKDDVLHGILGANNVITNSETYKTMNVRAEEDADFIALTSTKNKNICYYMNINQIPFTSSKFEEAHYFGGDARFTGRIVGNEHIVGKNLQAQQMVFAQAVEASISLISKGDVTAANNIEAQNELKGKDLHFTNMGINGGVAQPVEWVWDSVLERYVLCSVQEQGE